GDVARVRMRAFDTRGGAMVGGRPNESAADTGTFLSGWRPWLGSADRDWLYDRNNVVARARDASRNDVVGASAGMRKVNRAVGAGWRLASRVSARALGITQDAAAELRAEIDTQFRLYAYGPSFACDAERKKNFGGLLRLGASHMFHDGEGLGLIEYAADEPTLFKTRLRMVDPDRLSNPMGQPDTDTLRGGVERAASGAPRRYWIREGHPNDVGLSFKGFKWTPWERFSTPLGRPQVLHAFDEKRAGQSRGISAFVSVLKSLRGLNRFTDATLEATTINALLVAFVKSSAGPDAVSENFSTDDLVKYSEERDGHYEESPVSIGGARIPVLPFGDEIDMQTAGRDTGGFDSFVRAILRLIAAALGITYEELSMDFSQTNYSSARAALLIAWDEMLVFRGLIASHIATPFFVAWLEEAFDIGAIQIPAGAPDYYDAPDAYAECRWIGPGRGYIDPTKEIDAAAARVEAKMSTLEDECAEDGKDWREVLEQQAHEFAEMERLGLPNYGASLAAAGQDARNPLRDQSLEQRPAALGRVGRLARSPEHNLALDARPA
ncbi:MAG TPA: phage portal protein, partial [Rhizomicrobium sp.]